MLTKILGISALPLAILAGAFTVLASIGQADSAKLLTSTTACCSCCVDCTCTSCKCELLDCACDHGGACVCDATIAAVATTASTSQSSPCDCCDNCTNADCVCESVGCTCDLARPCACQSAAKPSSPVSAKSCCGKSCCSK